MLSKLKLILAEVLWIFERRYMKRATPLTAEKKLMVLVPPSDKSKAYFVTTGFRANSGGHLSILHLMYEMKKIGRNFGLVFDSNNIDVSNPVFSKFLETGFSFKEVKVEDLSRGVDLLFLTNWESYYRFNLIKKNASNIFMFVQDCEFMFFPVSGVWAAAVRPYYDDAVRKISLGEWPKAILTTMGVQCDSIPFPVTNIQKIKYRDDREIEVINVLVYLKPSFRRGGVMLIDQLLALPQEICGKKVVVKVIGYAPIMLSRQMKKIACDITFVGRFTENDLISYLDWANIGVCYSYTNISLVPYQFVWAGIPYIDIDLGSAKSCDIGTVAMLANSSPGSLTEEIEKIVSDYSASCERVAKFRSFSNLGGYDKTGKELDSMLNLAGV